MVEINLSDAVEISPGLMLSRFKPDEPLISEGNKYYYHITLKSVEDNNINLKLLERLKVEKDIPKRHLVKKGDIILKLSPPYNAAMVTFECENVVVSPNFAVLRTKADFDPEYLTHVLNGSFVKRQLNSLVEGGALPVIKKSALNHIKIRQRDKKEQQKYAKLLSLFFKRKELKIRTIELEESLKDNILLNI